jgi:uncharacterized membrane protein
MPGMLNQYWSGGRYRRGNDQMTTSGPDATSELSCPACQILDAADGSVDGQFFSPPPVHVRDPNALVAALARAQDRAADAVTGFAGSLTFVYLHSVWFGIWVALNVGLLGTAAIFDKFPFGLLTMIVSLEAIFLSTFVMVSQNRQVRRDEIRNQLDFETNLRAEIWSIHIGAQLGIDHAHIEQVVTLALAAANAAQSSSVP